ncbi:MAG: hypothetical protein PHV05_07745 [Candidatus Riflebacteria bacterium]|nr:hypothetical protein [Candidatus Riflebacteria bacterium]
MEQTETRRYHPTAMVRRDPTSQAILNRRAGKEVEDESAITLPGTDPELAKQFKRASEKTKELGEIIPNIINRMDAIEAGNKRAEEVNAQRNKEVDSKLDAVLSALSALGKPPRKGKNKPDPIEDFQGETEEEDGLPPAEK